MRSWWWAALVLAPGVAWADPCTAPLPNQAGQVFSGKVRYVVDGDGLCVGSTKRPSEWIEVRMLDFNAQELKTPQGRQTKRKLKRIAQGRDVQCTVGQGRNGSTGNYDRVFATCTLGGRGLGDLLRAAGEPEGGN